MADIDPSLPGADLIGAGLDDLAAGRETDCSLLVQMAAPRLRSAGLAIPAGRADPDGAPGHRLYGRLAERDPRTAHSQYNALTRRIVSFARAVEHARAR